MWAGGIVDWMIGQLDANQVGFAFFGVLIVLMSIYLVLDRRNYGEKASEVWRRLGIQGLIKSPRYWANTAWIGATLTCLFGLSVIFIALFASQ